MTDSCSEWPLETIWRERQVQRCQSQPVNHTCMYVHTHVFLVRTSRDHCTFGSRLNDSARFPKQCHLFIMSLLGVPVGRFPLIASSPTCSLSQPSASSTPLTGTRSPPCASARWSGTRWSEMSGCIATLTPTTRYEPKFCVDASDERTPINLPDSNRNFKSEEPDVPRHSGTSSSSKHTAAASRVPTALVSLGRWFWKQLADYESVDGRNCIQETGADLDRETVVPTLFRSESKGKRDRDQNVVQSLRDSENLHKILQRKAEMAVRGEKMAQQKK